MLEPSLVSQGVVSFFLFFRLFLGFHKSLFGFFSEGRFSEWKLGALASVHGLA
jgi:hypothetical protein